MRIKLDPRVAGLTGLAKLFGWMIERPDAALQSMEERLRSMTEEQHIHLARDLAARARAVLIEDQRRREREAKDR